MAKRYIRLNWQDKPNTATPISAANLNKMDKGIDDIDKALDALETSIVGQIVNDPSKINNAAVIFSLSNQVTELNNNLANNIMPVIDARGVNILDKVKNTPGATGLCYLRKSSSSTGLPDTSSTWLYSSGMVLFNGADRQIILYGYKGVAITMNYYNSPTDTWEGWKKVTLA